MSVSEIRNKLSKLEKAVESNDSNADALLTELKVSFTGPSFPVSLAVNRITIAFKIWSTDMDRSETLLSATTNSRLI